MFNEIEVKRRELYRMYDELEKLERAGENAELITHFRARSRQLADQITALGCGGDA